jgi:FMN phosphatase YigB (HAD superfamily)
MDPVIVFDLGKVLVDFDYTRAAEKISARCARPPAHDKIFHDLAPRLVEYETGLISRHEFFEIVRAATGFLGSPEEFGAYFAKIFSPITPMIELQAALRRQGWRTFLFSNTNDLAIEHVRQDFPFYQNFDGYILSYEVKAMKPEAAIYAAMEALCGRRGDGIIYIDDRPENIAAGAARGWRAVLHETPEQTRAELIRLGVEIRVPEFSGFETAQKLIV